MTYPIVIPSRGRPDEVATVDRMPDFVRKRVHLFVPEEEFEEYFLNYSDVVDILHATNYSHRISEKRRRMAEWVRRQGYSWFWMMDDDLQFARRDDPEHPSLRKFGRYDETDWEDMIHYAEFTADAWGDPICAVGISLRQGNNNLDPDGATNTRLIRCGLYNTEAFLKCEHDRIDFMGDFDVMLQMLRMGYDNHVLSEYCQDHRATNAKGGCETSRTAEKMNEVAEELARLHHPFVKTKIKKNKTGPLAERKDVTIYWKKARASADK